jgi:hypothetical protein
MHRVPQAPASLLETAGLVTSQMAFLDEELQELFARFFPVSRYLFAVLLQQGQRLGFAPEPNAEGQPADVLRVRLHATPFKL